MGKSHLVVIPSGASCIFPAFAIDLPRTISRKCPAEDVGSYGTTVRFAGHDSADRLFLSATVIFRRVRCNSIFEFATCLRAKSRGSSGRNVVKGKTAKCIGLRSWKYFARGKLESLCETWRVDILVLCVNPANSAELDNGECNAIQAIVLRPLEMILYCAPFIGRRRRPPRRFCIQRYISRFFADSSTEFARWNHKTSTRIPRQKRNVFCVRVLQHTYAHAHTLPPRNFCFGL